ncbi:MAG: hypothetical protein GY777_17430 [Candidatus Brocadiaceae bacterium]|nr:hypothetical protein [Candidatus Brocadiaceae bacterium]
MTVKELKKLLSDYPDDMKVAYSQYSEFVLLNNKDIKVIKACEPREDDWVQRERPDKKCEDYIMLPGN